MTTTYRSPAAGMRALGRIVAAYEKVSAVSGLMRPATVAVDRAIRAQVASAVHVCDDVVELTLTAPDLPRWQPGAHLDIELPGVGLRQYSLCGDPADRTAWTIAVRRLDDGDGGSRTMHALAVGDPVTLRGPRNAFPFVDSPAYLFVAGGIGVTPIRPMVHAAARAGADWRLVLTGRTRDTMPYADELAALDPARILVRPDDECGVPDAAEIVAQAPAGAALYVCGPPAMIDAVRRAPAPQIASVHSERFSAPPVIGGAPFTLDLARSGTTVPVAADETALTALRRVLPDLPYSCRQGFCGTCPVGLVRGDVEHRDRCLTPQQRADRFTPCVSRGTGTLTLDL